MDPGGRLASAVTGSEYSRKAAVGPLPGNGGEEPVAVCEPRRVQVLLSKTAQSTTAPDNRAFSAAVKLESEAELDGGDTIEARRAERVGISRAKNGR